MSQTHKKPTVEQLSKLKKQKTSIFQKYMIIRMNEIFYRKQLRNAFNQLAEIKPIEQFQMTTGLIAQKTESKFYTVELEIIRPKLRGEVLFNETFNVSDLKINKKDNKLYITKPSDSIAQLQKENYEKESNTKIQDLKQLIQFQKSMKDISLSPQQAKPRQNQIGVYQILVLLFVLYVFFLTL